MMYCGTSKARSRISAPPMMITATRTMIAVSKCVRDSPRPSDLSPERPGSFAGAAFRLNSGIWSPKTLSTPLSNRSGDFKPGSARPASVDPGLDFEHSGDEVGLRLNLDLPRPRKVDIIHGGYASRPRRHHHDTVGKEDRFSNRMGDEGDRLPRLHPDFLNEDVHFIAGE